MSANLISFLYLISGIFFILALRGLSNPESARRSNYFGIIGMIIASATTILITPPSSALDIILLTGGITIGGSIGLIIAKKIAMTAMPQLVAAFHSLVGLAAVLVASAALYVPSSMGIGSVGNIHLASLIEMGLGNYRCYYIFRINNCFPKITRFNVRIPYSFSQTTLVKFTYSDNYSISSCCFHYN